MREVLSPCRTRSTDDERRRSQWLLDRQADGGPISQLIGVELPRRALPHGQLRLELL